MREIVLDTETTGLSPEEGHRVIEIGAIEIINRLPTGKTFHKYINPEREIEATATRVHGITNDHVANMPVFKDLAQEFIDFVADSPIVAHNAGFDINFLNHELRWAQRDELSNKIVDTLKVARKKFPGAQASLDALCRRYEIDLSGRTLHGALLDAELLAAVYLELTGGQQPTLGLNAKANAAMAANYKKTKAQPPRNFTPSTEEIALHKAFVENIDENLWGYKKNTE